MLKLAKLLHARGFHVTFVNTEFNHRRLLCLGLVPRCVTMVGEHNI
jgi:hypothetical protein